MTKKHYISVYSLFLVIFRKELYSVENSTTSYDVDTIKSVINSEILKGTCRFLVKKTKQGANQNQFSNILTNQI